MSDPITRVRILPSYAKGFTFLWDISQSFSDPGPWTFTVEEGPGHEGPWTIISPVLTNTYAWSEVNKKRIVNKDLILFFRVIMSTSKGTYVSHVRTPYGDLDRRDYLIVREIMRREVLQQSTLAGIQALLWTRALWGPKCTECTDPFTGSIVNTNCGKCLGTGRIPPYHGPYPIWTTFSPTKRNTENKPDGTGTVQLYTWDIRMVGFPYAKDNDIVIDIAADKRYVVDGMANLTEIRRVPVVQVLHAKELPTSDPAYMLGSDVSNDSGFCNLDSEVPDAEVDNDDSEMPDVEVDVVADDNSEIPKFW